MILKLKFNKTVAPNILTHLDPTHLFILGIIKNRRWLCENTYRPLYLNTEIENLDPILWAVKWLESIGCSTDTVKKNSDN
jgi:hypothetical protein